MYSLTEQNSCHTACSVIAGIVPVLCHLPKQQAYHLAHGRYSNTWGEERKGKAKALSRYLTINKTKSLR